MPLQKLQLRPGVNRENTRYTNEGGWYESDKIRFRQGTPEKIGGWQRISNQTFSGVCRSLWDWATLSSQNLLGVGTNLKFYIENGGSYYDITPIRTEVTLTNPFTTNGTTTVTVTDTSGGFINGDYVTFYGGTAVGGQTIIGQYQLSYASPTTYTITIPAAATPATGGGTVYAVYQINVGPEYAIPLTGWGAGAWGSGAWGTGGTTTDSIRIWNQQNFGQDLLYGPSGGPLYLWNATIGYLPSVVTITNGTPAVVTSLPTLPNNTAITLETTGALPTGLTVGRTYYTRYITDKTFNLSTSKTDTPPLSNVVITGTAGQFTCSPSSLPLEVGQAITVTGGFDGTVALRGNIASGRVNTVTASGGGVTAALSGNAASSMLGAIVARGGSTIIPAGNEADGFAGNATASRTIALNGTSAFGLAGTVATGTIPGYVSPTTYYIIATDGSTSFTLSATIGGAGIVTTPGTIYNLTFLQSTLVNTYGAQSGAQSISPRGMEVSDLISASDAPLSQTCFIVSATSRFVILFGTNDYGSTVFDPMLIRWSDQESYTQWTPSITNQAGSVRLSHGSKIITALQSRQEILVWTDQSLFSLQYLGPPYVWGTQILADNVSIASHNAAAIASGVTYWMGVDKFYKYDGRVQTLNCDLREYIYSDINPLQYDQIFASTNEGFNEVWFFYCSSTSNTVDRYVVYNYLENVWYYGTMARTAWLDTGLRNHPIAATYSYNIVDHESGVDDVETDTPLPIEASITSSQFDIGDGHNFAFVYRMLPDLSFRGSTSGTTPQVTMYLQGLTNSGSGIAQAGEANVSYIGPAPSVINVNEFTGQVYIRIRARQMQVKITSNTLGTQWQLGAPRIDSRPDGRR